MKILLLLLLFQVTTTNAQELTTEEQEALVFMDSFYAHFPGIILGNYDTLKKYDLYQGEEGNQKLIDLYDLAYLSYRKDKNAIKDIVEREKIRAKRYGFRGYVSEYRKALNPSYGKRNMERIVVTAKNYREFLIELYNKPFEAKKKQWEEKIRKKDEAYRKQLEKKSAELDRQNAELAKEIEKKIRELEEAEKNERLRKGIGNVI